MKSPRYNPAVADSPWGRVYLNTVLLSRWRSAGFGVAGILREAVMFVSTHRRALIITLSVGYFMLSIKQSLRLEELAYSNYGLAWKCLLAQCAGLLIMLTVCGIAVDAITRSNQSNKGTHGS